LGYVKKNESTPKTRRIWLMAKDRGKKDKEENKPPQKYQKVRKKITQGEEDAL